MQVQVSEVQPQPLQEARVEQTLVGLLDSVGLCKCVHSVCVGLTRFAERTRSLWARRYEGALRELGAENLDDLLLVEESDLIELGMTPDAMNQFKLAVARYHGQE